jgi:hypothetical protein
MNYLLTRVGAGVSMFALSGCLELEEPRAIGPVVRLSATQDSIAGLPGETASVSVQALDVNDEGVSGAWITFVRLDATRLSWPDAPSGADAITVQTKQTTAGNVDAHGLAVVALKIADSAPPGDGAVIALVKVPADDSATLTTRITVHVMSGGGGESGGGAAGEVEEKTNEGSGGTGS